jgi:ABC-type uncharacterized transport system permease subunit
MSKLELVLVGAALACLIASFVFRANLMIDGLGKALFGVFLIAFFIERFFGDRKGLDH